ncbi:MAG: hypothetical protein RIR76_2795 [Verrucomicrobiota bacterium]|jgi:hypothetical protein
MSEGRQPSPDFDASCYVRPNKDWICGRARDGCPCRIGPSPSGECRASAECSPVLELKPSESKGTWKCTRPKDWGGPCETGPRPDGTCCRVIPNCQPQRSLRSRRGLLTRTAIVATAALVLIGLGGGWRESLLNPAPLSRQHSGPEFARLAADHGGGQGCVLCHEEINAGLAGITLRAVAASNHSLRIARLAGQQPKDFSRIDQSCVSCHRAATFHQANVVDGPSCSACHGEHKADKGLLPVAEAACTSCHGDPSRMAASAEKSRILPDSFFAPRVAEGVILHPKSRPGEGYTSVITSFILGHPEFGALQAPARDESKLKFNHRLHLEGDVPPVGGRRLECASCHQPDASGAFMQRVSFERNCRSCHSLNFDENNPGMMLPHAAPEQVRAYLRSLPTQYGDFAARELGITRQSEVREFVARQMDALRIRTISGENLERSIFFADGKSGDAAAIAGFTGPARARFAGCAYCHEVTPKGEAAPLISPTRVPDRWMVNARFNHARHEAMSCGQCHSADRSERTSDVIMPAQQSCTECHGPKGGVRFDCGTCHVYHNRPPAGPSPALRLAPNL